MESPESVVTTFTPDTTVRVEMFLKVPTGNPIRCCDLLVDYLLEDTGSSSPTAQSKPRHITTSSTPAHLERERAKT